LPGAPTVEDHRQMEEEAELAGAGVAVSEDLQAQTSGEGSQ
jgi:hypothetical protein